MNWLSESYPSAIQETAREKIELVQTLETVSPGILIVHNLKEDLVVYMSQRGLDILGVTLSQIRMPTTEYVKRFFHSDDAARYFPKIWELAERNDPEEVVTFFRQIRPSEAHSWKWYHGAARILLQDADGSPLLILTMGIPLDVDNSLASKVERLARERRFHAKHQVVFETLTIRETEVLRLMAKGENSSDIAAALNISVKTANTHRRNVRSKIKARTTYDITRFAQAYDLI